MRRLGLIAVLWGSVGTVVWGMADWNCRDVGGVTHCVEVRACRDVARESLLGALFAWWDGDCR